MLINRKFLKIQFVEILNMLLCMFFLIGINCWFNACGPMANGSYMTCHYAERTVVALASVLFSVSVVHLLVPDVKVKIGLDVASIPVAAVAAAVPNNLVKLCANEGMTCNAKMQPAVLAFSLVILAVFVVDVLVCLSALRSQSKKDRLKEKLEEIKK